MSEPDAAKEKLGRLLAYLERDPKNLKLLADAADTAFAANDIELAAALIDRHGAPLPPALENLRGTVALAAEDYAGAQVIFEQLIASGQDTPAIRFNLAWAHAMAGQHAEALALLDEATVAVSPRAPALKVRMLHHLDRYEEGLQCGAGLLQICPDDQALLGALATLAMDAEQPELARRYAARAGNNAEAKAALGMLALGAFETRESLRLFEDAVALQPENPRAWIGRGLAQQALGDPRAGAEAIDRGAALFEDHLGSWIAAGWAHVVAGDTATARARFETALAIDPNFSESHGGLAVLDLASGDLVSARRRADIALRLDKKSFGGALAQSLLLEHEGKSDAAQKLRTLALTAPIGASGMTIAQAMAGLSSRRRKS